MRLVLDSNEFIYAFGTERKSECMALSELIARRPADFRLMIPPMVVEEVRRNLTDSMFKECHRYWRDTNSLFVDELGLPDDVLKSYDKKGLKSGDAIIAAYADWIRADFLITENRDFLALVKPLPFRVLKASAFLKEMTT